MVHAYDQWVQLPVKDLYDNQIMLASIQAAKDMYEKGVQEMKDFKKEYGDFLSPIQADMDWYNKEVTGKVRDTINNLYANGIDPLRSPEGRAVISRVINGIDTGRIARNRASAENARLFQQARAKMIANGTYNPEFDRFANPDMQLENWDSANGVFSRVAPSQFMTLQELVHPSFKDIKPHLLTQEEVESRGFTYDPKYDWEGVTRKDMERVMGTWMPGVRDNAAFRYHREKAKQDLIREGHLPSDITDDMIDAKFVDNAITADSQILTPLTRDADKYSYAAYQNALDLDAYKQKAAIDSWYGNRSSRSGYGGNDDDRGFTIFDEARARQGQNVSYNKDEDPYYQWIDIPNAGVTRDWNPITDSKGKQIGKTYQYNIPGYGRYGNNSNSAIFIPATNNGGLKRNQKGQVLGHRYKDDMIFTPNGQVRYENGKYYMLGTAGKYVTETDSNGKSRRRMRINKYKNGTDRLYWVEIKERYGNYANKQKNLISKDDKKK